MAQKTTTRLPTIGAVIRALRISHGFSETELADKAGVRLGYVSEIENDKKTRPQEEYLEKLADALDVPLEDILGRRMPPEGGGAQAHPSSQQGVAGQGDQQILTVEVEEGEAEEEGKQAISTPPLTMTQTSMRLPAERLGPRAQEIDRLIASGRYSEEEEGEVWAAAIEVVKRFNAFKETQRKMRKEN